jgi:hypothetical protein
MVERRENADLRVLVVVFCPQCDQPVGAAFWGWDLLRAGGALCRAALFHGGNLSP